MTYQRWKHWVASLPGALRWFVYLLLLRPLIDGFYFLKDINPFLSPLILVGGAMPFLVTAGVLAPSVRRRLRSPLDLVFALWGLMLCLNAIAILTASLAIDALQAASYLVAPVFVFILMRHLIRSSEDILGLLTTFSWSLIVPFTLILFETFVRPIKTQLSRGLVRNEGIFADVASYGVFINLGLLVGAYLVLTSTSNLSPRQRLGRFAVIFVVGVLGLLNIHHATSFVVFAGLAALFLLIGPRLSSTGVTAVLVMVIAVLAIGSQISRVENVRRLYEGEVRVLEEGGDLSGAFHGRVARWERLLSAWRDMPVFAKVVGVTFDSDLEGYTHRMMVLKGTHSDYLRHLFASGIAGLLGVMLFLACMIAASFRLNRADRFLVLGAVLVLALYSVTLTPTLYASVQYVCFAVFAYACLPAEACQPRRAAASSVLPGSPARRRVPSRSSLQPRSEHAAPGRFVL